MSAGAALQLDHLVVAADTLEQGVQWCRDTLGVVPEAGGQHPLMGTHNRLLRLGAEGHPRAYLEIIAIDPSASAPTRPRWFGLDDAGLQQRLRHGPQLVHWVAACADLDGTRAAWQAAGCDPGEPVAASRQTPVGLLQWRITVRDDGQVLAGGALPTLIAWTGDAHPSQRLPECGVHLRALVLRGLPPAVAAGVRAPVQHVDDVQGPALAATLQGPSGEVRLSAGLSGPP